jgi:hypothetical protein
MTKKKKIPQTLTQPSLYESYHMAIERGKSTLEDANQGGWKYSSAALS